MLVLVLLLALSITADVLTATIDSGTCGENLTWTLDSNGTLTISGQGAMYNYKKFGDAPWGIHINNNNTMYPYYNIIQRVSIEHGVTTIGEKAFYGLDKLTSVNIPDTVYSIGNDAFSRCQSLTAITIPGSVNAISEQAFYNCSSLSEIEIENGVKYIENFVFYGSNLKQINIPASMMRIENHAFDSCNNLTDIIVDPNNVQYSSDNGSLYNKEQNSLITCPAGKTSFAISPAATSIQFGAFRDCSKLQSIVLSDNIQSLPTTMLSYCTSLTEFTVPNGVKSLDKIFQNCSNLETVYMPISVKTIYPDTFYRCYKLQEIVYAGTQAQWDNIRIDDGNAELSKANITCLNTIEPDTPTTPDTPEKPIDPTTPDTPATLPVTTKPGGLGSKLTVRVTGGHWLTVQVRRAGSIAITSVQAPGHGTVEMTLSAAAGSIVQVWETEQEMTFKNGVPNDKILAVTVKNV